MQVSAGIGRGMAVSDAGRLYSFNMPKAAGGAKKPKDGEVAPDPFRTYRLSLHSTNVY